jgi:hypothetical protein
MCRHHIPCHLKPKKKPKRTDKNSLGWNKILPNVIDVGALITVGKTIISVVKDLLIILDHISF